MSVAGFAAASSPAERADAPIRLFDPHAPDRRLKAGNDARVAAVMAYGAYINGPDVG